MKPPSLSVIVVTYRREQVLCDTLSHLLAQNYPESEILVVDQAPDHEPATRDFLRGVADTIRYIAIDEVGIADPPEGCRLRFGADRRGQFQRFCR